MSRYFSKKYVSLTPYTPGEQPRDMKYIKLNTNESPYPPSDSVKKAVSAETEFLQLYSDPTNKRLIGKLAEVYDIRPEQAIVTNGSDEALYFAFMAFADAERPLCFPDITYGFYPVFADLCGIPYETVPLHEDFTIDPEDYIGRNRTVVIANPNAPTGLCLSLAEIESIVRGNPDTVVIIDEAYVDFGAQSAVALVDRYENLLVTQTFSKSRSMAGARLGFAIGNEKLIADLHTIRCSVNPYNVNRMTAAAGYASLCDNDYYMENCKRIIQTRIRTANELQKRGFDVLPSQTNFLFARTDRLCGEELYRKLKERGILVRHFSGGRIADYNRITIGTPMQMNVLVQTIDSILEEENR